MKLASSCLLSCLLLCSAALAQKPASTPAASQTKNPVSDVLREMLPNRQKNTISAVEEMPAEKFGYKPTPEQMTFGHLVTHIIEANQILCAQAADVAPPPTVPVKDTDPKDKLVSALKTSFDFCSSALARADDSKLADSIEAFGGKKEPRSWAFIALASGWADHYATAAMYLRLNGLLPPTAKK